MFLALKRWAVAVLAMGMGPAAYCATVIVPTYEPAGVQVPLSSAICAGTTECIFGTENFNSWAGGGFSTDFGTSNQITGTYSGGFVSYPADEYGGAGGTGSYPEIFSTGGSYTLTLATTSGVPGVNYFGLWYSALDSGNLLRFYSGSTLVYSFTPADFIALAGTCNGSNPFCGNPTTKYQGQNADELYAFLNFFDTNGYFDKIVFSETGGGGFESDNHTVAYLNPPLVSGELIYTPEPGSIWLLAVAAAGVAAGFRRPVYQRACTLLRMRLS